MWSLTYPKYTPFPVFWDKLPHYFPHCRFLKDFRIYWTRIGRLHCSCSSPHGPNPSGGHWSRRCCRKWAPWVYIPWWKISKEKVNILQLQIFLFQRKQKTFLWLLSLHYSADWFLSHSKCRPTKTGSDKRAKNMQLGGLKRGLDQKATSAQWKQTNSPKINAPRPLTTHLPADWLRQRRHSHRCRKAAKAGKSQLGNASAGMSVNAMNSF